MMPSRETFCSDVECWQRRNRNQHHSLPSGLVHLFLLLFSLLSFTLLSLQELRYQLESKIDSEEILLSRKHTLLATCCCCCSCFAVGKPGAELASVGRKLGRPDEHKLQPMLAADRKNNNRSCINNSKSGRKLWLVKQVLEGEQSRVWLLCFAPLEYQQAATMVKIVEIQAEDNKSAILLDFLVSVEAAE